MQKGFLRLNDHTIRYSGLATKFVPLPLLDDHKGTQSNKKFRCPVADVRRTLYFFLGKTK